MMNETVSRIVELMFENAEMTEEVIALRDEVMNNCQERYADLVASGMSEDDAVSAVVESLKGMEEVVSQYQRKARRTAQPAAEYAATDEDAPGGDRDLAFCATEIHRISVALVSEDVYMEASDDADYHICWNADEDPKIAVRVEDGVIHVERVPGDIEKGGSAVRKVIVDAKDGLKNARVYVDGGEKPTDDFGRAMEKTMDDVGSMLENLGRSLGRMFSSLRDNFSGGAGVTIRVPENAIPHVKVLTTSGDVEVEGVALADLAITSTSGDVTIDLEEDAHLEKAEIRTVSGDVDATLHADSLLVNTTSGDVEVGGVVRQLTANTVSGDIDVSAEAANVRFKTISGDAEFEFDSEALREITGSTVSGDIDVDLPDGIGYLAVTCSTRSGEVTTRYGTNGHGPTLVGSLSSLSGDITIR